MPPRKRKNTPAARSEDSTPNAKRSCGASRGAAATENSQPVLPASSDVQPAEQEYGVASLRRPRAEESSPSSRRNSQEGGNYGASRPGAAAQTRREDVTLEDDLEVPLPTRERNFCNSPSILASTRWEANPTERLTEAIVNTLRTVREASMAEGDSRLLHRLTTAKKLPKFSGNPIEWLNFKEAYLSSAELGGYSRRENVARLFDALEGEARASVTALLATASDANVIIETLELQFGNKNTIAEKIASDISGLPNLEFGNQNIAQFAAKLRNSVVALKSINLIGYLYSPELIKIVANKLPSALRYAFNRYAAEAAAEKTTLEKLADFVYREAELAAATSIFDTDIPSTSYVRDSQIKKKPSRLRTAATYTTTRGLRRLEKGYTGPSDQTGRTDRCAFCSRSNHKSRQCRDLARETIQKRWALVRKNKLCFKCLDRGHGSKQCKGANCDHCDKPHHSLLHKTKASAGNFQATRKQGPVSNRSQEATTCPKKPVSTHALLDEGSTITLIERKLAREIGARGPRLNFALKGINDREAVTVASEKVELEIQEAFDAYAIKHAISVPDLNLPLQTLPVEIVERVKFTENVNVQAYSNARPRLLLGQDQWQMIATREFRELKGYMLGISRSLLGWAVHGSMPAGQMESAFSGVNEMKSISSCKIQVRKEEERLDELVKQYFQLDNFGVSNTNKTKNEHTYAVQILRNTARKVDNAWEVGLLWRKEPAPQVDSLATARQRLFSLERKLDRDPEYASLYYQEMDRLIKNGYAERVDRDSTNERVWYLPHFGVRNTNKPGRVRLVFDAAAKSAGISLNDQLESGPDLLQSLPGVLIRFRQEAVAVKADIKDMFLRIKVRKKDRGAQRFLWRGKSRAAEPDVYEMTSLIFGAKPSPCSAMFVKDENARSFAGRKPRSAASIINNSYMDDFLASRRTVQEAACLVRDVVNINANANFEMHGWVSNDERALLGMNVRDLSEISKNPLCIQKGERVLGLFWDTRFDMLGFNIGMVKIPESLVNKEKVPTKREYLRVVMSVFDPLGFLSRLTLMSKILMQEIWRSGVGWDDHIRMEEHAGWLSWVKRLREAVQIRVPRCVSPNGKCYTRADLHVFCDASLKAYAAVAYLRFEIENAPAHIALIMAKTRVAPLKPLSIPRLELQAALLASRLASTVQKELEIDIGRRVFWSDSSTVIRWIKSEPRTRQIFVAHRLGEIGELTKSSEWRWVPSKMNPADDTTRWSDEALCANQRWFSGPDFLRKEQNAWPVEKQLPEAENKKIDEMEMRKNVVFVTEATIKFYPPTGKFLGWPGLLAVARRVRGFVDRWRGKPRSEITSETVRSAEQYWFHEIQSDIFAQELEALRSGKEVHKSSRIVKLQPLVDENGILRASGRVTKVKGFEFNNNPIILDGKHPATRALVAEYHRRFYHASHDAVVNELRQEFCIVGLRNTLRSLINKCLVCKIRRGKPQDPKMATLPAGRLAYRERPFSHCGVDYFGPLCVKIGRRREKRWGVLFTCLTTRAIHLDLAHSLSASSAIMALQRLAARRGSPLAVYSDNGTNFVRASKELKDAIAGIDTEKQKEYAASKRIKWLFNPPDAPHMGGAWERMIRSVKTALDTVLRDQATSEEVLVTLLAEIEHSVNSRPLTHVSVDPRDNEALTPNHFLIGTSSGEIRLGAYEFRAICPRNQWRIAQSFADAFWKRWLKEYLPTLIPRTKWNRAARPLAVGDLVIIIDYQTPRNVWKRGTVIDVYPSVDGEVRIAKPNVRKQQQVLFVAVKPYTC
ncbi:uncharacterized protein LOC143363496 [Halictus rubicundus]|uniref:uncharacterized protein LOC143363496 n=1 Tax=Halictus rubicundus TaxID=77578 RepID=UPI004035ACA7